MSWKFTIYRATTLALALALCLELMQFSMAQQEMVTESEPQDMTAGTKAHSIHIEFCVSWGSKRNFLQVKGWLESSFPELRGNISGGNAPVPPTIELLLKIMTFFQFMGILFAVMGDGVFRFIGMPRAPSWYTDVVMKNSVPIMIGLFLILPQILNGYVVSGAFEVMLDGGNVIFSKIATGRMPQADDLIAPLTKAGLAFVAQA